MAAAARVLLESGTGITRREPPVFVPPGRRLRHSGEGVAPASASASASLRRGRGRRWYDWRRPLLHSVAGRVCRSPVPESARTCR